MNRNLRISRNTQHPNGEMHETDQGNVQFFDTVAQFESGYKVIEFDPDLEYNIQSIAKSFRLKPSMRLDTAIGLDTIVSLANVDTYFDSTRAGGSGGGTAGATPAELALINASTAANTTQTAQINTLNTSQTAQDALIASLNSSQTTQDTAIAALNASQAIQDSQIAALTSASRVTEVGNLVVGGTKASPVVINAASMPLSLKDGDYYVVNTLSSPTANYYDLTAIGYGIVNAGIGAKITFNATQNKYIYQSAGENQTAIEVGATPVVGTASTIALNGTNTAAQLAELAIAVKSAQGTSSIITAPNIAGFPTVGDPTKLYTAEDTDKAYKYDPTTSTYKVIGGDSLATLPTVLTGTLTPAQETALADNTIHRNLTTGEEWIKVGGVVTKLGDTTSIYEDKTFGFDIGANVFGLQNLVETYVKGGTFISADLIVLAGTFPATATTVSLKTAISGATTYITLSVPANTGAGIYPMTISIPAIPANTTLDLELSQLVPNAQILITPKYI